MCLFYPFRVVEINKFVYIYNFESCFEGINHVRSMLFDCVSVDFAEGPVGEDNAGEIASFKALSTFNSN